MMGTLKILPYAKENLFELFVLTDNEDLKSLSVRICAISQDIKPPGGISST